MCVVLVPVLVPHVLGRVLAVLRLWAPCPHPDGVLHTALALDVTLGRGGASISAVALAGGRSLGDRVLAVPLPLHLLQEVTQDEPVGVFERFKGLNDLFFGARKRGLLHFGLRSLVTVPLTSMGLSMSWYPSS